MSRLSRGLTLLLLSLAVLLATRPATAQQSLGSLTGTVTDTSGAVLSGAKVTIKNVATGLQLTASTNNSGSYSAFGVPVGTYTVTFNQEGFQTRVVSQVAVQANGTNTLDAVLQPGTVTTTVNVTATPLLNKVDTTNGYVLSSSVIESIPLGTGSFTQLALLSPGVNADFLNGSGTNSGLGNQEIWANGQRSTSNSIAFNGINADNLFNGATSSSVSSNRFVLSTGESFNGNGDVITGTSVYDAIGEGIPTPPPETIEELQVSTSMYDASQGAKSGAHIALLTKSGTNQFHGQAYDYFQNNFWNAAPFFYNADTAIPQDQKVPELRRNTFGALLGGPIKHDKAFFFVSYQGTRVKDQLNGTQFDTVPLQLTNDRSAAGLAAVASAQSGSMVSASQIDPAAMAIMNAKVPNGQYLVPTPSITDASTALSLGYDAVINGPPATFTVDQFNGNIDYNFSATDRLAGKYFFQRNPTVTPFPPEGQLLGFPQTLKAGSQAISLTNTRVLGPTATWDLKGGFIREGAFANIGQPLTAQAAGINLFGLSRLPGIRIRSGDSTLGNEIDVGSASPFANAGVYQNQYEGGTDLNWVYGKHSFSFGADYMRTQLNILNENNEVATIQSPDFASFLQGTLRSGTTLFVGESNRYYRANNLGLYAQDKIKVTPNLTVDAGLRFDYDGPLSEKYGHLTNFNPALYQYNLASDTVVNDGLVIAGNNPQYGSKGVSASTLSNHQFGFGPRLGLAWSPSFIKNFVVRAGAGIYYDRGEYFTEFSPSAGSGFNGPFGVTLEPPFVLQVPRANGATLDAPFGSTPPAQPTGNPSEFAQFVPNQAALINGAQPFLFGGYDAANKLPYSENWNFDLQWQPRNDLVMTLGYTGNHGNHLLVPIPFNQPKIATPSSAVNGQQYSYGYNALDSQFNTLLTTPYNTYDGGNTDLRAPFVGYSTSSVLYEAEGIANYNALQFSVNKRMSHGLQINASYTWSHSLDEDSGLGLFFNGNDPFNLPSAYGSSDFDRTHVLIISYLYQFPHLNVGRVGSQVLNGWGLSGVTTLESGQPYAVYDFSGGVASIYYGGGNDYLTNPLLAFAPGFTAQKAKLQGTTGVNAGQPVLDVNAFTVPLLQPGQNGVPPCGPTSDGTVICDSYETGYSNQGRNLFRGPFQQRFDFSVQKVFRITERWQLRYQADLFNLFNQPSFDTPNNNVSFNPFFANPPVYGPGSGYNACVPSTGAYACPPSGSLGVIQHTIGSPRFIQMSLHLIF
jgi:hypothetical protein